VPAIRRPSEARASAHHHCEPGTTAAPIYRRRRRYCHRGTEGRRLEGADRRVPGSLDVPRFRRGGQRAAVGGTLWSSGFHALFPEYVAPPTLGSAAFEFLSGGTFKIAGPLIARTRVLPWVGSRLAGTTRSILEGTKRALEGGTSPWLRFGNRFPLLFKNYFGHSRVQYGIQRLFWDDRTFNAVSQQYWVGKAGDKQLQHLWVMNKTTWVPRGFRNAGFNTIEVPKRFNNWMRDIPSRNWAFRGIVAIILSGTSAGSGYATQELLDNLDGHPAANPRSNPAPGDREHGSLSTDSSPAAGGGKGQ
jgi:hypothetical protein